MSTPIKLIAQSEDDLAIISTLMQDSTVKIGDIAWIPAEQRFAFVGNRYQWEKKRWFRRPKGSRVRVAFHLNGISSAQMQGVDLSDSDSILDLLNIEAIHTQEEEGEKLENGVIVHLHFSGGATIRLHADAIDAVATDLGESWEAIARPSHD